MQLFYNQKGIGDVLIVTLEQGERNNLSSSKNGDVVKIAAKDTNKTLGYNIFQASNYFNITEEGPIKLTEDWVESIQDVFSQNQLDDQLDVDLSPKFVVGFVKEKEQHENADKLSVCQVDVGDEVLQIVCGAPNVEQGQKVVVAKPGATMPSGMIIKDAKLRGVPSSGMICSAKELDLPDAPKEKGILVLDDEYDVGKPFEF
ncbi:YtpR family tRNA-binding protein [Salinibacillus xinjiangensis]|uniref:DUF4479 domain-containing protein n=1 Tax=Salinibacillus xinjiangensis TaxID=1229268 RepID=A0A6G1XA02_9BACI|nr:DUF4479 family protein [Salinibacillus xinjiangensis]MRG87735.1 DUF4479 domain-containing protein [Salinibacillus xinjiangensis]